MAPPQMPTETTLAGPGKDGARALLQTVTVAVACGGLALEFYSIANDARHGSLAHASIKFVSFFTVIANLLAALALLVPLLSRRCRVSRFLSKPAVRTAITGYLVIAGATFGLLLRPSKEGVLDFLANLLMHYATPMLVSIDWLLFVPKGRLPWTMLGWSLIVPIVFGAWTTVHGDFTGWYPYPFVNVTRLGHSQVYINLGALLIVFTCVAAVLTMADHLLGRHIKR
jgi:hypothetical protein